MVSGTWYLLYRPFSLATITNFLHPLSYRGFKRAAGQHVPKNTVAYYHAMFQKGKRELLENLRGASKDKGNSNDQEPKLNIGGMQQASQRTSAASLSSFLPFPSGSMKADLGATNFLYPSSTLTSQFLPQVTGMQPDLHLQQLLAQRGSASYAQQQMQQAPSLAQIQAQLLAAENAELRRLLVAGTMNPQQQQQQQQFRDPLTAQMSILASQLSQPDGASRRSPPLTANATTTQPQQQLDQTLLQLLLEQQRQREGQN